MLILIAILLVLAIYVAPLLLGALFAVTVLASLVVGLIWIIEAIKAL